MAAYLFSENQGVYLNCIFPRTCGFNVDADKGLHSHEGVLDDPCPRIHVRLKI